jgi:hypothetical protein
MDENKEVGDLTSVRPYPMAGGFAVVVYGLRMTN